MKRLSRLAAAALLLALVLPISLTAIATESTEETPTTVAEESVATVDFEPAVPITTPPPSETIPDWTYRYMIPTAIVLAVLVVVITCIQYFTRVVRRRYRIVEE